MNTQLENTPAAFIGIPWVLGGHTRGGADCYGIVILVLKHCYGITITRHIGATYEGFALSDALSDEAGSPHWDSIASASPGCLCVMYKGGRPIHVGVAIGNDFIIHGHGQHGRGASSIVKHKTLLQVFERIEYFRHVSNH